MNKDIDTLSLELAYEMLGKSLPPKVLYRYRRWMRKFRPTSVSAAFEANKMNKNEDVLADETVTQTLPEGLAKNETMASFFESGHIKMDFGADVSQKVKKAAMEWAKRKGLKVIEASLAKSSSSPTSITYSLTLDNKRVEKCVKQVKWSC